MNVLKNWRLGVERKDMRIGKSKKVKISHDFRGMIIMEFIE